MEHSHANIGLLQWRFDITRADPSWRSGSGWRAENLAKPGLSPATVIDVGAGHGTPVVYGAFPRAFRVLIEPLREFEEDLRKWIAGNPGELLLTAVGDTEGVATINVIFSVST
jgi:hypothetical protein